MVKRNRNSKARSSKIEEKSELMLTLSQKHAEELLNDDVFLVLEKSVSQHFKARAFHKCSDLQGESHMFQNWVFRKGLCLMFFGMERMIDLRQITWWMLNGLNWV